MYITKAASMAIRAQSLGSRQFCIAPAVEFKKLVRVILAGSFIALIHAAGPSAAFAAQYPSPALIDNFEDRRLTTNLGGSIFSQGSASLSFAQGSPFGSPGTSLYFQGQGSARLVLELVKGGSSESGPRRKLDSLSPSQSLSFAYRAGAAGQRFQIRLSNTSPAGGAVYLLEASDTQWHEICLGFPPLKGQKVFQALTPMAVPLSRTGALIIEALPGSSPDFQIQLDDLRFDPPAYANEAVVVATAMGASLDRVIEARGLNLPEYSSWVLMRLSEKCNCSPSQIYATRKTMSWGEMAEAQGLTWKDLLAEIDSRAQLAGIQAQDGTPEQLLKNMRNDTTDPGVYVHQDGALDEGQP